MRLMNSMMKFSKWNLCMPEMIQNDNKKHSTLRANMPAIFLLLVSFLMLLFSQSCKKENSIVGKGVLPPSDMLGVVFKDTTTLITYTIREDSVKSDETSLNLLGSYNDPIFGKSSASIYTQFLLSKNIPSGFGGELAFDSLVLILPYTGAGAYGTLDAQTVKVYQVNQPASQPFSFDSVYYSNKNLLVNSTPLANMTFIPKPTDSVKVGTQTYKPHLRIRLDDALGQSILNHPGGFADNPTFLSFLQGLWIVPDNPTQTVGTGAILYFNLKDAFAGMTLYYRDSVLTSHPDTLSFNFLTNGGARLSHFDHDYNTVGSDLQKQIDGTDLTQGQNLVYVQGISGLKTKIMFPYIKNYVKDATVVVNKAELVLKIDASTVSGNYAPPPLLGLVRADASGKEYFIDDIFDEGSAYFGGVYDPAANAYSFNIAKYIQQLMNGKLEDYGLHLLVLGGAVNANRVVLGGGSNSANKMRLKLTYTIVK